MNKTEPQNCWDFWNCTEEEKQKCPAFPSHGRECWEVLSSIGGANEKSWDDVLFS